MSTWKDLLVPYESYLRAGEKSPRTVQLRLYQIKRLQRLTLDPSTITSQDLIDQLSNPNWSPNTKATARASYVSFFRWASGMGHLAPDPSLMLPSVKVPHGKPKPASDQALNDALAKATPRVMTMIKLGARVGLRAMEIAAVHSRDVTYEGVDKDDNELWSLRIKGKGSKTRIVPIAPDIAAELNAANGYIFPGRIDGHVSPAYVSKLVSRVLPPGVTCHKLRHRFATRAYKNTHNLRAVQQLLGHASVATTEVYTFVDNDELRQAALAAE